MSACVHSEDECLGDIVKQKVTKPGFSSEKYLATLGENAFTLQGKLQM